MPSTPQPALIKLRSGRRFFGELLFDSKPCVGELVFHTSMSGYQEIVTDPSYSRQIVTFTYPHIGSTGINPDDMESECIHVQAVLVRCPIEKPSNYRSTQGFFHWLAEHNIPVLSGIDTRAITHHLRDAGAQDAAIVPIKTNHDQAEREAKDLLAGFTGLANRDLATAVTRSKSEPWQQRPWHLPQAETASADAPLVVVLDYGVKNNILRMLAGQGLRVLVVPAFLSAHDVLALKPSGVLLANGPGDPAPVDYAIATIRQLLTSGVPLFGICLGFQLLALALGARTSKMKFGHHGANHPVQDVTTKRVFITSQNHGFMVDTASLKEHMQITHLSLFDGSLQGFALDNAPVFAFQGHPEASPGPHDIHHLFDTFAHSVRRHAQA